MPLVFTIAFRNLFHDRLRLIATVIGIVFSIVLVTMQMGLYLGFGRIGDDDDRSCVGRSLDGAAWNQVLRGSVAAGRRRALSCACDQRTWRTRSPSSSDLQIGGCRVARRLPFSSSVRIRARAGCSRGIWWKARIEALSAPRAVAVDRSYFDRLGVSGIGAPAEIRQQPVQVAAVTSGIRSFTTTPYVFMDVNRARTVMRVSVQQGDLFSYSPEPHCRYRPRPPSAHVEHLRTLKF